MPARWAWAMGCECAARLRRRQAGHDLQFPMINPLLLALTVTLQAPSQADAIAIIPKPVTLVRHPGAFTLRPRTVVMTTPDLKPLGQQLIAYLRPATGVDFTLVTGNQIPAAAGPRSEERRVGKECRCRWSAEQ